MSQTKQWTVGKGNTTRNRVSDGHKQGEGNGTRIYVGRFTDGVAYDYRGFLYFTPDWTNVGQIVSAVINVYTDDGLGDFPSTTTESPIITLRRITSAFTEGSGPSTTWQDNDATWPASIATNSRVNVPMSRAQLALNQIDVTAMIEDIAPSTVKRRNGTAGGRAPYEGILFLGDNSVNHNWAGFSEDATDPSLRPTLTLTYEYGPTAPDAPTNMVPSGTVAALTDFSGDFSDIDTRDKLASSAVQVYDAGANYTGVGATNRFVRTAHGLNNGDQVYVTADVGGGGIPGFTTLYVRNKTANDYQVSTTPTGAVVDFNDYSSITVSKRLYSGTKHASATDITLSRFVHVPDNISIFKPNTTYRWRAYTQDNEGSVGAWSSLVSFSFQNTQPNAPTLTPASGASFLNPDAVQFRGTFSDPNAGDKMVAYEVQLSAYPEGDSHWDDDEFILWNTGKRYVALTTSPFQTPYGGNSLDAGTYYWRARVYDNKFAPSDWTYASITFTQSFESDPEAATTAVQLRPRAPWRIVIKAMGALRGPGATVAILEDAKNVGASELYNSPGELHFTLPKDHPQISVIEPKQTHYSVQFRQGDGWHETFAGLMDDFDATDTDVVFYGIDYLALYDRMVDERYDASNANKPAEKGGSYYVTAGKNSIAYIVGDQITQAKNLANSPVGFITKGSIATMTETLQVYSTYSPVLSFITGLLDSHRNGTGKRTRARVRRTNTGGYEFIVQDDPGVIRDNFRMRYGELVQGYRVVAFGTDWATRVAGIGRAKDGVKVMYDQRTAAGLSEVTWGRFTRASLFDGVSDANDLRRRIQQAATAGGKLGKQIGLGIRSDILQPKDGYDVTDIFPIDIEDGSVSTDAFGSGYWQVVGVTWECSAQDGKQTTTLTFQPREDSVAPDSDLLTLQPISPQAEWQIGWTSPNPLAVSSRYWLDQTTGKVYVRADGTLVAEGITGTA